MHGKRVSIIHTEIVKDSSFIYRGRRIQSPEDAAGMDKIKYLREDDKMKGEKERINKALDRALERVEYIIDYVAAPDFVEVTGRTGGDTLTYRFYNDGSVAER